MTADGTGLIAADPTLAPFEAALRDRYAHYAWRRSVIDAQGGLLGAVSQNHHVFGFHRGEHEGQTGVWYREWAPGAHYLSLIGEFNHWDRGAHPMQREANGVWSIFLPDRDYGDRFVHGGLLKVHVASGNVGRDRLPAYIRRVVQEPNSPHHVAQYWNPPLPYSWQNEMPTTTGALRIYEVHVGMAQEAEKVGTFNEFTAFILPRIARQGYNAIQLMAVMEHPYYASFGYHVSNFFAVSSRFGTPEELKALVDTAHGLGIKVIMDIVHSHSVKNIDEGLNQFDGTDHQYFHPGERGMHPLWDSLLFDYGKEEVLRCLLSNVRFWREEYQFDGFRFDGVTSMLYQDHGIKRVFGVYDDYFGGNVDRDALAYLMLANELVHSLSAISIAEDVSGMPGMARPVAEGGLGFDYRLAMGIPDYWVQLLKEKHDEEWDLGEIYYRLLDRRHGEKHIGYVESHDQALVGDQTLAFQLMDATMYSGMSRFVHDPKVTRGIALLKLIRLLTFSVGGEGYLNFMGNEFGHPEWIDFPRPENDNSYQFARRQWSLADRDDLRYYYLNQFDHALMQLDDQFYLLEDALIEHLMQDEAKKILVYRRGALVFVFNFHPTESYVGLGIPVPDRTDYRIVLNTDDAAFDGKGNVVENAVYWIQSTPLLGREQSVEIYLPARSAQVLAPMH